MFRITALDPATLDLSTTLRVVADASPGYPCRVSLQDAAIGETVYAFSHTHHDVSSPYRASGPVFVREGAQPADLAAGEIPLMLDRRRLSLRAYDEAAMMIDAEVIEPGGLRDALEARFTRTEVAYVHLHNAGPGCFNCAVVRA
jgi:hypothetical protein